MHEAHTCKMEQRLLHAILKCMLKVLTPAELVYFLWSHYVKSVFDGLKQDKSRVMLVTADYQILN